MSLLLSQAQFSPVYHGTLTRHVGSILRSGLRKSAGGNNGPGAYLSDSLEEGEEWARYASWNNHQRRDAPIAVVEGHPIRTDSLAPDRRRGDWVLGDTGLFIPKTVWHGAAGALTGVPAAKWREG